MVNETDLSLEKKWFGEERAKVAIKNLQRKNINAQYCDNREEALRVILEMVPQGATVGRGDSVSIEQIGIMPELFRRKQNVIIDPFKVDADGNFVDSLEDRQRMEREIFFADVFLVGSNAVTLDGKLVNVDGHGNRVAAMVFGPRKVIIAAGVNKIVKDVNGALERIRQVAAPMNAKRIYLKRRRMEFEQLPCVRTGQCVDCAHEWKICRFTVIIDSNMPYYPGRINVVLVGEELGI